MNGIINVYKEAGYTSFDVVARLRGILKQKKIGHLGTLDPAACGVLPVALGKAAKLTEFFHDDRKTYVADLLLGQTTDTLDCEGTVLCEKEVNRTQDEIRECIESFKGDMMQVPPMYSALKKDGKRLYELARKGIEVEREARPVTFFDIKILSIDIPYVRFEVTCSKGTYIRSLCSDIGEKLGCGGCMSKLLRTKTCGFDIENALTLSQIEEKRDCGMIDEVVIPMEKLFPEMPDIKTAAGADKAAHNGNAICMNLLEGKKPAPGQLFKLYDSAGILIGIYKAPEKDGKNVCTPEKMLYETGN